MKTYELQIDQLDMETGMICVSLVDAPAVESNFITFSKQAPVQLSFADDEKHIITGVALRADYPIYRNNETYGEHYVVFTKDLIRNLVEKYAKYGMYNNVNLNHNEYNYVNGDLVMVESYLIDKERGICPNEFKDIEDGSWIISYKVLNVDLWDQIKKGEFKGFSIEGMFTYNNTPLEMKEQEPKFEDWVDNMLNDLNPTKID